MNSRISKAIGLSIVPVAFMLTLFVQATGEPAKGGKGAPPDGIYNCHKISGGSLIGLGNLTIKGKTYRGIGDEGKFAAYTIDGSSNITWSAGLDGLPSGWKITSSKYAGNDSFGKPLINIYYVSGSGNHEVIDAVKEK